MPDPGCVAKAEHAQGSPVASHWPPCTSAARAADSDTLLAINLGIREISAAIFVA